MNFSHSVIDIIKRRKSKRTYISKILPPDIVDVIKLLLNTYTEGFFGNKIKFYIIEKESASENQKVKLGTYGFISGARYFIAGEAKKNNYVFEDFGYLMEKIILHLSDMNLGTCWLGGTFSRSAFARAADTDKDSIIPCVTPVGYATDTKTIKERLIRYGAKADSRKAWEELFYCESFSNPLNKDIALKYELPLEMVRLAPSASNKQPWRILKTGNDYHFYLKRTPGYNKYFKNIDLQKIDLGIAMAHFELSCTELGLKGSWKVNPQIVISHDVEYIVSWVIE